VRLVAGRWKVSDSFHWTVETIKTCYINYFHGYSLNMKTEDVQTPNF
jgi:hypothetical protein